MMRGMHRRAQKLNNAGFSLVELLVAMIILMIIVVPLLHSFVTAANVNGRAKKVLQATTAAQNIMEQIKASKISELRTATVDSDGVYTIEYTNQQVDNRTFRVVATLDPNTYKKDDPTAENDYNDESISTIYDMNSSSDAFLIESPSLDTDMAAEYGDTVNYGSVYQAMERTVIIDIDSDGSKTTVSGSILYSYHDIQKYGVKDQCIFSGINAEGGLRNIYVMFEPMYTSTVGGTAKEHILVNNPNNLPVNLFFVKQENSRTTQSLETNYKVAVNVKEGTRSDYLDEAGNVNVVSKLHSNLTDAQVDMKYNDLSSRLIGSESFTADQLIGYTTLAPQMVSDRIYEVEVKVYDQNDASGEELVSIEGTKAE